MRAPVCVRCQKLHREPEFGRRTPPVVRVEDATQDPRPLSARKALRVYPVKSSFKRVLERAGMTEPSRVIWKP